MQACGANRAFRIQNLLVNFSRHPTENICFWSFLLIYLTIFSYLLDNLVLVLSILFSNFWEDFKYWIFFPSIATEKKYNKMEKRAKVSSNRSGEGKDFLVATVWWMVGESWKYLPQWSIKYLSRIFFLLLKKIFLHKKYNLSKTNIYFQNV